MNLGVCPGPGGATVAVFSAHATAIEFCLFDGPREIARHRLHERSGDIHHAWIPDIAPGARYGLRAHGPYAPAQGHRFNPNKLLIDPYAKTLDAPPRWHPSQHGDNDADSAPWMPKAIVGTPERTAPPDLTPWAETLIYELHVKGFTARHPAVPHELRGRFAGLAHPAAIAHLVDLGITTVELMPTAAWIEEPHLAAAGLTNHWGYNPVALMAPDPRLAPGGWPEIRATVAALAAAGIETILDVVLNHTGEGDPAGPTLSLRGLDNASYYRLHPDDPARNIDDTGCGNTLAFDHPFVLRLAMDSLRAWAEATGAHGFRFDLATTMGRRADGFDPAAPLLSAIAQDPLLRTRKLIAEPWDPGPGGYQAGAFPADWGEWNDRFRDDVRRFWRGEPFQIGPLATRLAGSADLFGPRRRPSRGINFVTAHDGFTLADLTAYAAKHNEANAEANRDGTDANHSWNHGVEGPTDDPAITAARRADQRALLATLLLARGTPMLAMGAESGHSQAGNNNAYAQDNETAWLDWTSADPALLAWTRRLTALRRAHPALRADHFLTGAGTPPDVRWLTAAGTEMTRADWTAPEAATLQMLLDASLLLLLHRGDAPAEITLPPGRWRIRADSAEPTAERDAAASLTIAPRSVLLAVRRPPPAGDDALLAALAEQAGIAPDWWSVTGQRHPVSPDTHRALLAALRLPASTQGELRDSLRRLAEERLRPLPRAVVATAEATIAAPLAPGLSPRPLDLLLEYADGRTHAFRQTPIAGRLTLPDLPLGRHLLRLADRPDIACHLARVPATCHLPDAFARGERRFGLSTQLYALRRPGDQGIGDFTTLATLATAAAAAGAATIGLNPLHMLFPAQRDRASPYHPSDRRFLDPIYIDTGEPGRTDTALIDYPAVWAAKLASLERRFAAEADTPDFAAFPAFAAFIAEGGDMLAAFAHFQAQADGRPARFHAWLQFLADRQLAAAATGLELGLLRDLAVGAAPDGAEAFATRDSLAQGAHIGAPPDPFAPDGQNWHLPPPLPAAYAADGFAAFATLLRTNMRHAGALRIDHVMGLNRLFWIPDGATGADGAYVAYPMHDLIGHLALESQRARCMVIGEDLGTVPDALRPALRAADILSYRVLLLERDGPAFRPAHTYPSRAVACVSTHDLPPLLGWWQGCDIAERQALGLLPPGDDTRPADTAALADAIGDTTDIAPAAHRFIADTASDLMLVQTCDLEAATTSINLPGTDTERPNWRLRSTTVVGELLTTEAARSILSAVAVRKNK